MVLLCVSNRPAPTSEKERSSVSSAKSDHQYEPHMVDQWLRALIMGLAMSPEHFKRYRDYVLDVETP